MIILDGRFITDELSGIGRYTLGLISGLSSIEISDDILVLGGCRLSISESMGQARRIEYAPFGGSPLSLRNQIALPRALRRMRPKLFHSPYVGAPLFHRRVPTIITVHDLIPQRFPHGLSRAWKVRAAPLWNAWCRTQYRRADHIVTVSEFSKRELIEFARVPAQKIVRIYNGVVAPPPPAGQAFRERFAIPEQAEIVSYIGRHDPYKNIELLVRAFPAVRESRPNAVLIIAGAIDARYPEAKALADRERARASIHFTGYLDESMRASLLRASSAFAFPSRYEGFGLPPLEAMAAGVPVVASNATSLPEVLGSAATLVDPDDVAGLARGIVDLLRDECLRARRIEEGYRQAARFTWRKCAEEHLALFERVMQETR